MNALHPIFAAALNPFRPDYSGWLRTGPVHWCGFDVSWTWEFPDGEGPVEIILAVTASSEGKTVHSVTAPGNRVIRGIERELIIATLENDAAFRDYLDTRFAEEADEARAWG